MKLTDKELMEIDRKLRKENNTGCAEEAKQRFVEREKRLAAMIISSELHKDFVQNLDDSQTVSLALALDIKDFKKFKNGQKVDTNEHGARA
mmetsp:Transcript_35463/g.65680  ORF Transcript_35463/g.65680 Transcript_35463/m.65680 type:complete len:91 (-) Transcript_35463:504-776(-)